MPDITALIMDDHEWFRRQFAALDDAREPADLDAIWGPLAVRLDTHAEAEETIFYPRLLKKADEDGEETEDAIKDHNKIRDAVADAGRFVTGSHDWFEAVGRARTENSEHLAEEEDRGSARLPQAREHGAAAAARVGVAALLRRAPGRRGHHRRRRRSRDVSEGEPAVSAGTPAEPSAVRAQDDLFRHVNAHWLDSAEIPDDRATFGAFEELRDNAELAVREIIEEAAAASDATGPAQLIGDLYRSFMDTDAVEAGWAAPLTARLAEVDALTDVTAFVSAVGRFERAGVGGFFGSYVDTDPGQPDRYTVELLQGGLGLPDESYYREEQYADIRTAYVRHLETILGLAGVADAGCRRGTGDGAGDRTGRAALGQREIPRPHADLQPDGRGRARRTAAGRALAGLGRRPRRTDRRSSSTPSCRSPASSPGWRRC